MPPQLIRARGAAARTAPGGMRFDDRWVCFAMTINWFGKAEHDRATVEAFAAAGSTALQLVVDAVAAG